MTGLKKKHKEVVDVAQFNFPYFAKLKRSVKFQKLTPCSVTNRITAFLTILL